VLKGEIARLARREIKAVVDPLKKVNASQRRDLARLKREIADLRRDLRAASSSARKPAASSDPEKPARFQARGLKSLRARLGLSAADFGRLAGASAQSVYNWEAGKTLPAPAQRSALAALRGIGKREAAGRLAAL
jgi:DNA-binding transcriptional regulator YiaG